MLVFSTPWLGRERVCVCRGLVSSPRHIQGHQTPAVQLVSSWCCDSGIYVPPSAVKCTFRAQGGDIPEKGASNSTERGILKENKPLFPLQNVSPVRISAARGTSWRELGFPGCVTPCLWLHPIWNARNGVCLPAA